ncbi:uncharacterized protein B0P05DRAFT_575356 [Gilbertella persicaria]|uniref:uncharacterized protein n=1 Tax=Gilbertella persicaria TaxID=101096 RepID=UPI00222022CD|nr:uncharacterized protein B0P05DRAFT_575356 [Gilbertella persicaria]KAI8054944.1 hypothetical protein B0P05DRAFT_575356 [Gilbertella persicaria]
MIAQTQPRRPSYGGSIASRSKQEPVTRTKHRSKSISAGTTLPYHVIRRPSAPILTERPRLSIADRFMSTDYTKTESQPSFDAVSTITSVADRFMSKPSPTSSTLSMPKEETIIDPTPVRLTIAETFMRSSSTLSPCYRSRAGSFADELERPIKKAHPLEPQASKSTLFDDAFHLDLTLDTEQGRKNSRPWGSQDTLVQLEKKKPIYAQYMESEKNATIDCVSFDDKQTIDLTHEEDEDTVDYSKFDHYYQKGLTAWENEEGGEEEGEDDLSEQEKQSEKPASIKASKPTPAVQESRGCWIGCCFISSKRPQHKKKDLEQQRTKEHSKCCGRKIWVFCTFLIVILCALVAYFLWPRTPLMRIEGASLTSPVKIAETKQNAWYSGNVQFESEWLVNVTIDNRRNHVPTRVVQIQVLAKDALTGLVIGKGTHNDDSSPEHIVLPPNTISTIQLPVRIDYQARDSMDTTFADLIKSCSPKHHPVSNGNSTGSHLREALPLHFWITLHFFGLDWLGYKPTVIAAPATGGFACPQP